MLADLLAKLELRTNERNTAMQDAAAATSRIKVLGRGRAMQWVLLGQLIVHERTMCRVYVDNAQNSPAHDCTDSLSAFCSPLLSPQF